MSIDFDAVSIVDELEAKIEAQAQRIRELEGLARIVSSFCLMQIEREARRGPFLITPETFEVLRDICECALHVSSIPNSSDTSKEHVAAATKQET